MQGGYYTLASWLPTYLKTSRGLAVVGTGGYLAHPDPGAFLGYVCGGNLTDKLGRKRTILLFAVLSAVLMVGYTQVPEGANTSILILGFPLGFCTSAIFSGFGSYLAELYPTQCAARARASRTTSAARSVPCSPAVVGFLAATRWVSAAR